MAVVDRHYLWLQPYRRKLDLAFDSGTGVEVDEGNALSIDTNGDVDHLTTSDVAFAGFAAISATSGEHDASTSTTVLTDSSKSWTSSLYVGRILQNVTDGSFGVITANNGTTITVANGLTGGTDDDFDSSDDYKIKGEIYTEGIAELTITGVLDTDHDALVYASGSNAFTLSGASNLPIGRVVERRGTNTAYVHFKARAVYGLTEGSVEIATGTFTLSPWGATDIDSSGGAVTGTLGSGQYIGQLKTIVMSDAANVPCTVEISLHQTTDPEVATFDAVDETGVFLWTGTEWVTIFATCTFV